MGSIDAYGGIAKLELKGRMSGIGGESLEGFLGHTDDHGALCQRLGSISLASGTLERDGAIDGDGERHKGGYREEGNKSTRGVRQQDKEEREWLCPGLG